MQKAVKLVIKIYLFILFSGSINSQTIEDNYLLINKVIELTRTESDSIYKLLKSVSSNKDKLEKYYNFNYFNKPLYREVIDYDEQKDSLIYDDGVNQKKREHLWSLKYAILDSIFTKKDIEYFLQQNEVWVWNTDKLNDSINLSNDNSLSFGNIIHKPYYSLNHKYAIVQHISAKTFTSFYIFKKEKNEWLKIGSIKNIW
ncbi:hypothetical protein [Flavivirga algicola]|uniref:GLPGLI family protein n=1 Tax=Flavivirga algicola TaxID=2729136 RepID=A0ABX1RZ60_9FLAO|nr:hypothetical protein [Flavivirga algicola]NMH87625.1 hypothetical protein [Flavivirga algicola]